MVNIEFIVISVIVCVERFYRNHLKSKTHINNIRKMEEINKSFEEISLN